MDINEILEALKLNSDEDFYSNASDYLTILSNSVNDAANYKESAEAKINQLTQSITELTSDNEKLKAANYDLLMRVPGEETVAPEPSDEQEKDIDDLFD